MDLGEQRIDDPSVGQVSTSTGSSPIGRRLAELSSYRVHVDVVNRGTDRIFRLQVPVIAGPFLPETKDLFPRPLLDGQSAQERAIGLDESFLDLDRTGPLDGRHQPGDPFLVNGPVDWIH